MSGSIIILLSSPHQNAILGLLCRQTTSLQISKEWTLEVNAQKLAPED